MELRQAYHRGEAANFAAEAERLRREATYHLRDRPMSDADNWRLQNELHDVTWVSCQASTNVLRERSVGQ